MFCFKNQSKQDKQNLIQPVENLDEKVSLSEEFDKRTSKFINKQVLEFLIIIALSLTVILVTWGQLNTFGANSWVFFVLININAILMLVVLFLVARNVIKLILERKRKVFGARLRTRLVLSFVSVTFLPILLMFLATNRILTTSVNYWFTSQVENSMQAALGVGQSFYNMAVLRLNTNATALGEKLSAVPMEEWKGLVLRNKTENNFLLLGIVQFENDKNSLIYLDTLWFINQSFVPVWKNIVLSVNFANAEKNGVEPLLWGDENGDYVVTATALSGYEGYYILCAEIIGKGVMSQFDKISAGFKEYQSLKNMKQPLKISFSLILGLLSLIVLFASVWLAFRLSKEIVEPILALSKGTKRIAKGAFETQVEDTGKDELGNLVTSFNAMANEVNNSQKKLQMLNELIEGKNQSLMERNQYIEAILEHITTGVITLNEHATLLTMNKAACDIFQIRAESYLGLSARVVLGGNYTAIIDEMFESVQKNPTKTWVKEVELIRKGRYLKILVQAVPLLSFMRDIGEKVDNAGYVIYDENVSLHGSLVVVLEDITELSQEQRLAAWKEVAKRIAHEIKNPLTPIKLSVERMERRFGPSIDDPVFTQCTSLIIKEVNRIQSMVSDFSGFAVMPAIDMKKASILPILKDLIDVFKVSQSRIHWALQVDDEIARHVPEILLDKKSMYRALYNIMSNAVDAVVSYHKNENTGSVCIKVYCTNSLTERFLTIDIIDNGEGLEEEEAARLFEPYFSKKPTGTGLGLAIVQSIVNDHHGTISANRKDESTVIQIRLPIAQ